MKKTILLILNVLCLLLVCGCNNGRLNYDDQNIELYVGDTYIIEVSDKSFTFEVDNNELIENDSSKISLIKLQSEEDKHEELNTQTEINFFGCDMDEDYNKNNVSFALEDEKQPQFFF